MQPGLDEEMQVQEEDEMMYRFRSVLRSARDFFAADIGAIYHSTPLIRWQLAQQSTCVHSYRVPKMAIMPEEEAEQLRQRLAIIYG